MRSLATLSLLALTAFAFTGCTTVSGGGTGALIGGLTGAGIGAIAGDPAAGALLGTGLGLGFGSMVGSANEDLARRQGWVYDDMWGSRGHYAGQPVYYQQPMVYEQPVVYQQPVAYQQPYCAPQHVAYVPPAPPPVYYEPAYPGNISFSAFYGN